MKSLLTISFIWMLSNSFGQIPSYFENDPKWQASFSHYMQGEPCINNEEKVYYISGDTSINLVEYKIVSKRYYLHYTYMSGPQGACDDTYYGDVIHTFVRQWNDNIYYYDGQSGDELLISYNVGIGDTLINTDLVQNTNVVHDIDTLYFDGQIHRKFMLDSLGESYVIEGVGHFFDYGASSEMFQFWSPGLEYTCQLQCYSLEGISMWSNPTTSIPCNYLDDLGINDNSNEVNITLSPNPTTGNLKVNAHENNLSSIAFYDIHGKLILIKELAGTEAHVDLSILSVGVFFAYIEDVNGNKSVQRIVKQ